MNWGSPGTDRGLQDEGRKCRWHPCPGQRCKAPRQPPGAQRRGPMGSRRPWRRWSWQARRQRPSASSAAVGFIAPRAASSAAVGHTAPRAASAAAVVAAATVRTVPWRVGTIACLFPLRPARTLPRRMSSDTSRAAKHVFSSASVHCPAG